jgi:DNA-binding transcriptional LysR family regulator
VLTEIEEGEALATARAPSRAGICACCCSPAFAVHQLANHLAGFRCALPRVTLELRFPALVETVDEQHST